MSFTKDLMILLAKSGLVDHLASTLDVDRQEVENALLEFSPKPIKEKTTATKAKKVPEKPVILSKLTVSQLKELCTEKDLSAEGKKSDLISRLEKREKKEAPKEKPVVKKTSAKTPAKVASKAPAKAPVAKKSVAKKTTAKAPAKAPAKVESEESESESEQEEQKKQEKPAKMTVKKPATKEELDRKHMNYESASIAELKKMLDERGLSKTGKRDELIERLIWGDLDTEIDEDLQIKDEQPVEEEQETVEEADVPEDGEEEDVPEEEE